MRTTAELRNGRRMGDVAAQELVVDRGYISPRILSRLQSRMQRLQMVNGNGNLVQSRRADREIQYALRQLGLDETDLEGLQRTI